MAEQSNESPPKYRRNITHCPQNHEYTPENTVINSQGRRICKTCRRLAKERFKASLKQRPTE